MIVRKPSSPLILNATLMDVRKEASNLEGIHQYQYTLTIMTRDEQFINEWIPIRPDETDDTVIANSVLDQYLQEVIKGFPELADLQNHEEVLKGLQDKSSIQWVRKPMGRDFQGFPRKNYLTPRPST